MTVTDSPSNALMHYDKLFFFNGKLDKLKLKRRVEGCQNAIMRDSPPTVIRKQRYIHIKKR